MIILLLVAALLAYPRRGNYSNASLTAVSCYWKKESQLASHQSGHNSGVIHAGLYYHPQSLKARFCREGAIAMRDFCQQHSISHQQTGKLLVATDALEYQRMETLFARCTENQIAVQWLSEHQLHQREANIRGLGAIYIPDTGMVDYVAVSRQMARCFKEAGGELMLNAKLPVCAKQLKPRMLAAHRES